MFKYFPIFIIFSLFILSTPLIAASMDLESPVKVNTLINPKAISRCAEMITPEMYQETYSDSEREWIRCTDRPTGEMCHATCYDPVGDKIYNFAGYHGDDTYYNWTYQYDPTTDTWASMAPMPSSIDWIDASVIQWNRSIYIFGGFDGVPHDYNYIYEINSDSWSSGINQPLSRIAGGQVVYNDSLIYMLGGYDGAGPSTDVQVYNTYTDAWTVGTPLPAANMMEGVAILGDTIWLVGGYNGASAYSTLYYGVINPANCENITWSVGDLLAVPNSNNGATQMVRAGNSYLYIVGGFENAGFHPTNHAWEYGFAKGTWTALPGYPMTIARNDLLVARDGVVDTFEIYVCGGDKNGSWAETNRVWKLSLQVGIAEKPAKTTPLVFGLSQNVPNPVKDGKTAISFTSTRNGLVTLKIYDISGRQIRTLITGNLFSGFHTVVWNGRDDKDKRVSAGVYFYRLTAENKTATKTMVFVR
ncbi:MAG: T9SS type A sorting domain-containing protein [Candidatus Cloacimonadota bacterium]|nr:MAG: T9SS type A sorting domain-containing protein [Candidatus Cloacimonadota bacterium]